MTKQGDQSRALNAVTTAITSALGGQTDIQVAADANLLAENIKSDIRDLTAQAIENCLNFL
ncbi:hypothetical protein [Acinetobacter pittii]|uniref:hypothetical protein n=1 Tax=Acinetobacter pittii TaxID=48296 RepID=UPI002DBBFEA1|nr:hypothetical protein [Acinetobacter pittii]MEB7641709.1 hypothetical protein [Acinetobacter pittii]